MICANCGAELLPGAMFCGECGYSVAPRRIPASGSFAPEPPVVGKVPPQRPIPPVRPPAPPAEPTPSAEPTPTAEPVEAPTPPTPPAPNPSALGETSVLAIPPIPSIPSIPPIPPIPPVPSSLPAATQPRADVPVFHAPAPVPPPAAPVAPERFVLQFSTGESVTVTGTGIVGRNPSAEPGEYVDHLVTVVDYDKSVSKRHLDFGQENGRFWVSDRFSANGTTVREPDRDPRRCAPGVRVHVARGSRVDMGEQFFIIS